MRRCWRSGGFNERQLNHWQLNHWQHVNRHWHYWDRDDWHHWHRDNRSWNHGRQRIGLRQRQSEQFGGRLRLDRQRKQRKPGGLG